MPHEGHRRAKAKIEMKNVFRIIHINLGYSSSPATTKPHSQHNTIRNEEHVGNGKQHYGILLHIWN